MISKQETFKKLLSNDYKRYSDLDEMLWKYMKSIFKWSLTLDSNDVHVAFRMKDGVLSLEQIYENNSEWHNDIRCCLIHLDRI